MERINEFDNTLREAFEKEAQSAGIVFICRDLSNRILPCSPNKIAISSITTLTPHKRMLPIGFQTEYKTNIRSNLEELDRVINNLMPAESKQKPFIMELPVAYSIIDMIENMLIFESGWEWDVKAFMACMEYLSRNAQNGESEGKLWCIVKRDRNASRYRLEANRFEDRPDTGTDLIAGQNIAKDIPVLMLLRQNGREEQGWRGSPFWWPVMVSPQRTRPVIFASELVDID